MLKLDYQSRKPIFEQLKEQIVKLSMLGVLSEDEKLPSVRSLARELGINPNTVQKAYQDLEREGLIYTVNAKGSFVAANQDKRRQIQEKALLQLRESVRQAQAAGCSAQQITEEVTSELEAEKNDQGV